ncbi:MAG: ABC transporter ATP-binding protein [Acidimicrobiia bacterium]|nr:ABC transporter ATP-binding protein [Acidimicrobiia bacterium]
MHPDLVPHTEGYQGQGPDRVDNGRAVDRCGPPGSAPKVRFRRARPSRECVSSTPARPAGRPAGRAATPREAGKRRGGGRTSTCPDILYRSRVCECRGGVSVYVQDESVGPASGAVIELRDVSKAFGSHQVLDGISFDIPRGAVTNIMGPSGTGKSVLLKNIIGLLKPERGSIHIDGEDVVRMSDRNLYKVRMKMGVLFQDGALFGSMDLFDNIAFPLREHTRYPESQIRDIVHEKAELVGLKDHLRKYPGEISGGMKKRGGLARALVLDPEIVLFDEPDSGLDPVRVAYLDELILTTKAETNATFVVITHNIDSTTRVADYMAILFRSRLAAFGSKHELFASPDPVVRQFLHGETYGPIGMDELADAESELQAEVEDAAYAEADPAMYGYGPGDAQVVTGAPGIPLE